MWGDQFPADRAVDGNIDQWRSHEHCALPDRGQGTNAWWQVDLGGIFDILRVEIYSGNNRCKPGYFGGQCQFKSQCRNSKTSNDVTGHCPSGCPDDRWGVGCILNINNYYNDPKGTSYMGKLTHTTHNSGLQPYNVSCIPWIKQKRYYTFPDGGRAEAVNYCRNPSDSPYAWCYRNFKYNYAYCILDSMNCVTGRFDVNCVKECHCSGGTEDCQKKNGGCQTECAPHFNGDTCQGKHIVDIYFGVA
ncbi:hypothetical protein NP493_1886g00007 [Ridgeia piscesae]|uniref:Kringle domain-containing protein n=1 Tax=Ridgeia piscesae TaxID=27915 RepID=A0AAD9N6I4_RIDPI|nr:hypothetical protein NP493_1886g00007 [Ridgeia piscesae]